MLPTSVVSFMKKMTQTEQNSLPDVYPIPATSNSLCKIKKTLSASLNQVQISAKATLSAKGIGFSEKDVGDIFRKKINRDAGTEKTTWPPQLEEADSTEINPLEADVPDKVTQSVDTTQSGLQQRQYDRLTSCRVCVRSLSSGNEVVSFRFCSECNYKVCEDCASYSDQDCELEQSFWRCSICRRRSASPRQTSSETTLSIGSSSRRGTFASDSSDSQLLHESHDGARLPSDKEKSTVPGITSSCNLSDSPSKFITNHGVEVAKSVLSNDTTGPSDKPLSLASPTGLFTEHRRRSFRSNRSRNLAEDTEGADSDSGRASSIGLHGRSGVYIAVDEDKIRQHRSPSPNRKNSAESTLSPGGIERSSMHRRSINQSRSRSASAHEDTHTGSFDADHIRIVVDHVDSTFKECSVAGKKSPYNTVSVRIHREGPCPDDYLFTDSFGLSLAEGDETQITYIQPAGPAHKAGLECGDVILYWDGIKLAGSSIWDVHEDLKHSGDSIEVVVLKRKSRFPRKVETVSIDDHLPQRPSCLATSFLVDPSRAEKTPLSSPTRRRLPRAPLPQSSTGTPHHGTNDELRTLLKVMVHREDDDLSRVAITVLNTERSLPSDQRWLDEELLNKHLFWIHIKLLMPRGIVKEFSTEPIGFQDTMDCTLSCVWSSLPHRDLAHSLLNISAWETVSNSDSQKIGDSSFKWRSIQTDGRPFWVTFDPFAIALGEDGYGRRLSKASSHDPPYQRNYDAEQELSGSSESFKELAENIVYALPRSRSAENNILKLEIPHGAEYGLSAPASLAPSRRNSSALMEDDRETKQPSYVRCNSFSTNDLFIGVDAKKALSASYENLPQVGDGYEKRAYLDPSDTNQERGVYRKPSRRSSSHHESGRRLPNPHPDLLGHAEKPKGQVKLGIIAYHGQVDVEVIGARSLPIVPESNMEPDTFIQVTLYDCNGVFANQKTKTMRQTCNPKFHQTLSFKCPNRPGLLLIVDTYAENGKSQCSSESFRRKNPSPKRSNYRNIGRVSIALDNLPLETLTISWHRLVPENVACL